MHVKALLVMARAAGDAVATGWISSLARPGGNVTGMTDELVQLSAKRMELLKEAVPNASVIAILWNAADAGMTLRSQEIEKAARILKVEVQAIGVRHAPPGTMARPSNCQRTAAPPSVTQRYFDRSKGAQAGAQSSGHA